LLAIGLAPACGRTALDVRRGLRAEVDAGARIDGWPSRDAPLANDAQLTMDVPPPADAQEARDLAPAIRCAVLQPLADGVLTSRHTVRALFTPNRSSLALQVKGEGPSESSVQDDLLLVRLPSGEVSPIMRAITSAEWLQPGATLLVSVARDGSNDLVVVGSDGSVLRTLVRGVCDHAAAPDGSRVFAIHDCDKDRYGTLDVIEVASGANTRLALAAGFGTWNPHFNWVEPQYVSMGQYSGMVTYSLRFEGPSQRMCTGSIWTISWTCTIGARASTSTSTCGATEPSATSTRGLTFSRGIAWTTSETDPACRAAMNG
jgi:hypothetical protein